MNTPLPTSISEYLDRLRAALAGADPALVQDALYDAEEYLRSELAEQPGRSEADVIAAVASSYGAPDEVADIYRDTEAKVQTALTPPRPKPRQSLPGRFFGVIADPRTYGALFYMLLALATGIFYFTWVVTGASLSLGLAILVIGIPFVILFVGSTRVLSLVEGRIVEAMLGERMPRRPLYANHGKSWGTRIAELFTDPRTWATMLYFLLMLPLGIAYFFVVVTGLVIPLSLIAAPFAELAGWSVGWPDGINPAWAGPLALVAGVLLLFVTLHVCRLIGRGHAQLAKHLLVRTSAY